MSEKKPLEELDWVPVSEVIDLGVTAQTLTVTTKLFSYITQMRIVLLSSDAAIEWTEFSEGLTLTNGFKIMIDGVQFGNAVKTVGGIATLGKFFISPTDLDAAKVAYVITAEMNFLNICSNMGIQCRSSQGDRLIQVVIGDDMSGLTGLCTLVVEGWKVK